MAERVNVYEAKTHLSRLLERVEAGEEIVIARNGRPVAVLVPAQRSVGRRVPGALKGALRLAPDFDEPEEALVDSFYDSRLVPPPGTDG